MTDAPDPKAHLLLAGLAQQARYVHDFAKAGRLGEALEHAGAIDRLITAWRAAAQPDQPVTTREDLEQLVQDMAHSDPCRIDHNGDCQEHFWFPTDGTPCPHGRAQALFPNIEETSA